MVQEEVVLLHLVLSKGLEGQKAKIKIIQNLPIPTTLQNLRSFLGHIGFYPRVIKGLFQSFTAVDYPSLQI